MGSLDHLRPLFLLERGANAGRSSLGAYRRRSSRRCGPTQADQANVASGGANGRAHARQRVASAGNGGYAGDWKRSEEHTSELQSLMRISYAVFCLKKKKKTNGIQ